MVSGGGWGALIQGGLGLAGGGVSLLGASRKKKALNAAEEEYYNAMQNNLAQEHGISKLQQQDYLQLAGEHNTNLGGLIDNFTGAQPVNDGFDARLADTVGKARSAVPVMDQSWAYQGTPATTTTNRELATTDASRARLADAMGSEHQLESQQDQQLGALEGFKRGEMPIGAHADQLAQYYGVGKASRGYDYQAKKNALAMALKKAGYTGDEQMMWGALISSLAGAGGAAGSSMGGSDSAGTGSGSYTPSAEDNAYEDTYYSGTGR